MTPEPIADGTFRWILTFLTLAASLWAMYDVVKLAKLNARKPDGRDPLVRDERFGYVMGILIGAFAISGLLLYHDVI